MSDTNNKKYNIDDLVNSLLLERQPNSSATQSAPVAEEEDLIIVNPIENDADVVNEVEETPVLLLNLDLPEEEPDEDVVVEIKNVPEQIAPEVVEEPAIIPVPSVKEEVKLPNASPVIEAAAVAAVSAVEVVADAAPKKRKKRFGRKMEDTATIEQSWADWGLKPIGHYRADESAKVVDVVATEPVMTEKPVATPTVAAKKIESVKSAQVDEFPAVAAVAETITMPVVLPSGVALPRGEEHTRVISTEKAEEPASVRPAAPVVEIPDDDQLPDQLSLEEMVRVEDIEPAEGAVVPDEDELDPEERLQLAREEKVREFTLEGDEEEENEPEEEPIEEEVEEIEDFTSYEDTETVAAELKYRCRASLISLLLTGFIQFGLLIITLLTVIVEQPPMEPSAYLLTQLFGLGILMVLNFSTITRGLSGLFSLRANNDSAPALASLVCLADVSVHLLNMDAALPYWTPLAGLLLVLSAAGHYSHELCVRRNFSFVSYPGDKYAAAIIEDESALQEIGRRAVSEGDATVAYFRRTGFLTDYLANAYDDDDGDDWSRLMTPVALGLSLLLSLLALTSANVSGMMEWMSIFTGMICLSMPVTMLAVQLPLSRCSRRILSQGGFLTGWKAVRRFGQPDALAVDIADLYPDESMLLHGIKTFSGSHIDEAILMAASLVVRAGGPLSMVFRRIIENKEDLLYEVDSLVYEQGMGLSGWVDGRRVFVGNSRLLQNHGVDVPSSDYEARYATDGRRLVYVSVAGQLTAMFVVSYLPDPEIQSALQELCRARVTLLVRSCDPNITTSDLCESFELDEYYVDVLPAAAGRAYVQLTEQPVDSLPALMASNGHILGTARVLSTCRNLQIKVRIALVIQTIAALLGLVLCLWWATHDTMSLFLPLLLMLMSLLFSWLIPALRRT